MRRSMVTQAIKFIEKKLTGTEKNSKEVGDVLFKGVYARSELNKQQDNFVCCFVDDGYYNYYNIYRIADGKVKAFHLRGFTERIN